MKLNGAQILIETLIEQGVDCVFGYPGGAILNIHDALYDRRDKIRHILTSHEQGAAHAADGYARSTGRVGVCMATSGPGATNLVTGLATAFMDSVPVVAITGNVPLDLIGRDSFQEVDIQGITMPITKHNFLVKDVNTLADTIRSAFRIAAEGRPGPVLIDIPKNITVAECEWEPKKDDAPLKKPKLDHEAVKTALEWIADAKKPLIYAGGGVVFSDSSPLLKAFVEKARIPVAFSMMGLSALPYDHPLNLGMIGMHGTPVSNRATIECDLLIAIGARFSDRVAGNRKRFAAKAKIIHIDIDTSEQAKNVRCDLPVTGHAGDILKALAEKVTPQDTAEWLKYLDQYRTENPLPHYKTEGGLSMREAVMTVGKVLKDDAFVVTDVGQHQMITAQNYNFKYPRTFISSCGLGTMGYGLGAAIGVKTANPDRQVVLISGDGSFHMNLCELACAVTENLPITIVVFNNSVLGMVRQWQRLFYKARYSNTDLKRKTDLVMLAKAFGAQGCKASNAAELENALKAAVAYNGPYLIECAINKDDSVFPIIPPGGEAKDIILSDKT